MKIRIHREGIKTVLYIGLVLILIDVLIYLLLGHKVVFCASLGLTILIMCFVSWFFRQPYRPAPVSEGKVIAPADGTIITIDEMFVGEFFEDYRTRVSIFMSGGNVHINWIPLAGYVRYQQYNPGRHLFARHPKSSDRNERSTVVIEDSKGKQLMMRQIAGIMARRVVTYPRPGRSVSLGDELGFIKFGSRVDLFFPKGTKILVKPGDKTIGRITEIAEWS
ncbi:MAG: phosphatidylserine decarboxylase family protein [Bacteroidales bacterium]|nr:phosphatidylserine decarboxylase family protein [Bacteroidales bacterium]